MASKMQFAGYGLEVHFAVILLRFVAQAVPGAVGQCRRSDCFQAIEQVVETNIESRFEDAMMQDPDNNQFLPRTGTGLRQQVDSGVFRLAKRLPVSQGLPQ